MLELVAFVCSTITGVSFKAVRRRAITVRLSNGFHNFRDKTGIW